MTSSNQPGNPEAQAEEELARERAKSQQQQGDPSDPAPEGEDSTSSPVIINR